MKIIKATEVRVGDTVSFYNNNWKTVAEIINRPEAKLGEIHTILIHEDGSRNILCTYSKMCWVK